MDGRPHPAPAIKLWNSDSRGHWEGSTLVVDVANSNSKGRFDRSGNFASDQVHLVEHYIFDDPDSFTYQATIEDPTTYTRPWTISTKIIRVHAKEADYEPWEEECWEHEKNSKEVSDRIDTANK